MAPSKYALSGVLREKTKYATATHSCPPPDHRPVVISGPSGVGKGTLSHMLADKNPGIFALTVSHTTRKPRDGEVDSVSYFYVSPSTFSSLVSEGAFVEHAFFAGNYYGTSKKTIADRMENGLVAVLDIELQGVKQMKSNPSIDARYVFIKPPSFESLEARLRGRGSEKEEDIQRRLSQARLELEYADTPGSFDKIIVNDDLETAYKELEEFIYKPIE